MNYKVSENVLQATLTYLSTKPHQEVSDLINALRADVKNLNTPDESGDKTPEE